MDCQLFWHWVNIWTNASMILIGHFGTNINWIWLTTLTYFPLVLHICVTWTGPVLVKVMAWRQFGPSHYLEPMLSIGPLRTHFGEIRNKVQIFSFMKKRLKMSAKWWLFRGYFVQGKMSWYMFHKSISRKMWAKCLYILSQLKRVNWMCLGAW